MTEMPGCCALEQRYLRVAGTLVVNGTRLVVVLVFFGNAVWRGRVEMIARDGQVIQALFVANVAAF
jgi:hypothetical protein